MLALVGSLGHYHRCFADTLELEELVFDLADLDPETADLDLRVAPAEELQLALGQPAPEVAAPVQALTGAVRIWQEGPLRALGVVDVPAADTHSREDDLTGRAER